MNALVLGAGGREHAIACTLAESGEIDRVYWMPGNGGAVIHPQLTNVPLLHGDDLVRFARDRTVALTVVGPEQSMADGIVNRFNAASLRIFGFPRRSAQLEWSKVFARQFAARHDIPVPQTHVFHDYDRALSYLAKREGESFFIKADELCAGKGALFAPDRASGQRALELLFHRRVCGEGKQVLIEEAIAGEEVSLMAITDAGSHQIFPLVRDYKRLHDGDLGPNTGGMGAYAPVTLPQELIDRIVDRIVEPTFAGMIEEGLDGAGVVYFGVMVDRDGDPHLLEYNMRFGDPETQALLPLLASDLYQLLSCACSGELERAELSWHNDATVCVVATTAGYPLDYGGETFPITGLDGPFEDGVAVFHAATQYQNGKWFGRGGRIFAVTARKETLCQAREAAYRTIERMNFAGIHYRREIAG
ncbi:phosphoribosylamine--glycine ligase [Candidatus Bipolaricaulota bacterium]|nr:phosphoribosylamine--glycine ligase [Candidatus Bipolaricaulota bacterium]